MLFSILFPIFQEISAMIRLLEKYRFLIQGSILCTGGYQLNHLYHPTEYHLH